MPRDLAAAEAALAAGDLEQLGAITEANALAMHASAIAARPAVIYWQPATLAALAEVRALRAAGRAAWATIDAGPARQGPDHRRRRRAGRRRAARRRRRDRGLDRGSRRTAALVRARVARRR